MRARCSPQWYLFNCVIDVVNWSSEVTTPLSMKEVGGYIEKQVAYLSGESSETYWMTSLALAYVCVFNCILNLSFSRRPWGRFQCHCHPPRVLGFQWHSRGSFVQSVYVPHPHPSVWHLALIPVSIFSSVSALHQKSSTYILSTVDLQHSSIDPLLHQNITAQILKYHTSVIIRKIIIFSPLFTSSCGNTWLWCL